MSKKDATPSPSPASETVEAPDPTQSATSILGGVAVSRAALVAAEHGDPHLYLGSHPARLEGRDGAVVRAAA